MCKKTKSMLLSLVYRSVVFVVIYYVAWGYLEKRNPFSELVVFVFPHYLNWLVLSLSAIFLHKHKFIIIRKNTFFDDNVLESPNVKYGIIFILGSLVILYFQSYGI